ncbi:uncharacterized protein LOC122059738 isoform X1 [Macadamia integrifolia]|uniref:uncharacterized protein LOC122059738 isoform X1 n=1 Tax=Macadamia integrifolia TaxID=60698 RepID=UPI001C4F4C74|nr:uncharacterized protein LOC122059738 isoform X1 [Macadamia integrifolia]
MEEHQLQQSNKDDDEEEFYEKIEAPKYVDFTVPDLPLPDDRSWFCLRVGCNQKHEEEDMDPDVLYKSFVLRVLAARSPNLKLHKELSRQAPRENTKYPQSAPAKSSKNRISRLTAIALASQKMGDKKLKLHPISRLKSASNMKATQSSVNAKALTTPRYKKCLQGSDPFRSAQNPKTTVSLTKNRVVSKALIFHTPKKSEKVKNSLTELRAQMKKLDITSQKKQGRSRIVSSRYNTCNTKSKGEVSFVSYGSKDGKAVKSSKCLKTKNKANLPRCNQSMPQERIDSDYISGMEIDGKSRDGSSEVCSVSGSSGNIEEPGHVKLLIIAKTSENLGATPTQDETTPIGENSLASSSNVTALLSNLEETLKEKCPEIQTSKAGNSSLGKREHDEDVGLNYEDRKDSECDTPKSQNPNGAGVENSTMESDDKENASVSCDNREIKVDIDHSKLKILSKHEAHDKSQKLIRDCSASAAIAAQKNNKTKSTNPKPFRLRTDERGILKEANLDRRLHLLDPFKENAEVKWLPTGSLHKRHITQTRQTDRSHGGNQTGLEKRVQKLKDAYLKTSKCATETNVVSTIRQRQKLMTTQLEGAKEEICRKAESSSKKTKSHFLRPQRMAPASKATVPEETASAISQPKELVEPILYNGTPNTISKAAAIRSGLMVKRPAKIPKEPNFHSVHVPKSCTKKLPNAIAS